MIDPKEIAPPLLAWWDAGHADLPWRQTRDPYAIWIAEIMLQQTQIATVLPYYERWMARFPSVEALAGAPLDEQHLFDVVRLDHPHVRVFVHEHEGADPGEGQPFAHQLLDDCLQA